MDLSFLSTVLALPGPFATAYLDVDLAHENARHQIDLRWRGLRDELAVQGADAATLEALDVSVATDPAVPGALGRCLVATGGDTVFDGPLPAAPRRSGARWSPLADIMPYLAQLPRTVPYVVAVVDRAGADLYSVELSPVGLPGVETGTVVDGDRRPITKIAAGGWSQRRYQQRAENLWEQNAEMVAGAADRLVVEVGAEVLLVAGDPRARAALRGALAVRSAALLVETDAGGRAPSDSDEALAAATADAVTARYEAGIAGIVDAYGQQPDGQDGLAATVEALREHRVDTLILRDDPDSGAELYVGPLPDQLAREAGTLAALGIADPARDRADAALIRAAAATDAGLVILSPDRSDPDLDAGPRPDQPTLRLRDGIGFLARY